LVVERAEERVRLERTRLRAVRAAPFLRQGKLQLASLA
jgi:hypothetical protein